MTSSSVLEDCDTGASNVDHYPVMLELLSFASCVGQGSDPFISRFHLDGAKLTDPLCRKYFSDLLENTQTVPWCVDVDTHCRRLCKTLSEAAGVAFAKRGDKPKRPYITDRTWHLVKFRRWLLRSIKLLGNPGVSQAVVHSVALQLMSSSFLDNSVCSSDPSFVELYVFAVWSFDGFFECYHPAWYVFCRSVSLAFPDVALEVQHRMRWHCNPLLSEHEQKVCSLRSAFLSLIRYSKRLLARWINSDKVTFLEGVSEEVGFSLSDGSSRAAWQKIRCLLAWGGKKRLLRPHSRKRTDGSIAQSYEEIANIIQDHFASIECAKAMTLEALAQQHNGREVDACAYEAVNCDNIISLHQLARQISSAPSFKAPGLDGITNDMLKGAPQQVARHLHPLLCKMSLGCKEPLMLKGSLATDLYKGRGCKLDMTSYRSIVCSSVLSKHHHKFLRSRLLSVVVHFLRDTQCGGIPSRGVDMASLLLRSFLARTSALKRTALVVFYDVKTAFYAVIRQMLLPVHLSREEYLDVLDSVDIPLQLLPVLEAAMACPALVPEITSDKQLTAILTDAHMDTWFHVQDANEVAATLKGTRPGDSLADLLFSLLLSPVLAEVQELEVSLGLAFGLSKSTDPLFATQDDPEEVLCTDVTFADDTAFMGVLPVNLPPDEMLSLVHEWALGIHNIFVKRALIPNYDVGKSSLLLVPAGKNSTHYKKVFAACEQGVWIEPALCHLRLVDRSKHLGSMIVSRCSMDAEIAYKKGKHVTALAPLKRAVFRKSLREEVALNLVDTLATSVLLTNASAWWPLTAAQTKVINGRLAEGYRQALRWKHFCHNGSRHTHYDIFFAARRLDAAGQLAMARIRFLSRICNSAPSALRLLLDALRYHNGSWSFQLALDCDWAIRQWGVAMPQELSGGIESWVKVAASSTKWTDRCRTLLKYAKRNMLLAHDLRRWHIELSNAFRLSEVPLPVWMNGPGAVASELVCYECGAVFASRTALAVHSRILHGHTNAADQRVTGSICLRCHKQFHSRPRLVAHLQRGSPECLASYLDHVPPLNESAFRALKQEDALDRKRRKNLGLTDLHADLPVVRVAGPTLLPPLPATLALCQTKLVLPHVEVQLNKDEMEHVPIHRPFAQCQQFILCPFVLHRSECDFQAQIECLFMKEGKTVVVLSPKGDSSSFDVGFWMSLIRSDHVMALYISLPMCTWNFMSGASQPVRSMREIWGMSGLALESFQWVRSANFAAQTSLLLMLAAGAARVPALWCHPSPVEGELCPSLWLLPEVQWTLQAGAFATDRIDSCTFGCPRKDPVTVMSTNLPSVGQTVVSHPTRFLCVCRQQHSFKSVFGKTPSDINEGLVAMLARCVYCDIGLLSNEASFTKCDSSPFDNYELACHYMPFDPYVGSVCSS